MSLPGSAVSSATRGPSPGLPQHEHISLPLLAECLTPNLLHLIVLPTEACNFRCVYCYESFQYKRMERWVVDGIKRLLTSRAPDLNGLTISWFGGEPLLASDWMLDIMHHAQALVRSRPSLELASDATTNGYLLTPGLLANLTEAGVSRYQISFDGPREYHDSKRVMPGNRGTYDRIWANLSAAKDSRLPFKITVRVHVNRENMDSIPRFIEEYASAFGDDPRFDIFIRLLSTLGGPNDSDLPVLRGAEGADVIQSLRERVRAKGLRQVEFRNSGSICYAARANSFVVRANGRINKCTVALESPSNQVGLIRPDGSLILDGAKIGGWMRGLTSADEKELHCPMHGFPADLNSEPTASAAR